MSRTTEKRRRPGFFRSLGALIIFQFRLACDALRDFIMSPLSIATFVLDALFRPEPEDSFHLKLMMFGRRTDRWINLFQEFDNERELPVPESTAERPQTVEVEVEAESDTAGNP